MIKRFAILVSLVSASLSHAADCESAYRSKSSDAEVFPKFESGAQRFVIQFLTASEVEKIEGAWVGRMPGPGDDRSTDYAKANERALSQLDLGGSSVVISSLKRPRAAVSVPNAEELCKLVRQERVIRIWSGQETMIPWVQMRKASSVAP